MPAEEALAGMTALIRSAREAGMNAKAGIQCALGCVYQGLITETAMVRAGAEARNGK
jgi:hydroxymethylglutaryl-CoA lyase